MFFPTFIAAHTARSGKAPSLVSMLYRRHCMLCAGATVLTNPQSFHQLTNKNPCSLRELSTYSKRNPTKFEAMEFRFITDTIICIINKVNKPRLHYSVYHYRNLHSI